METNVEAEQDVADDEWRREAALKLVRKYQGRGRHGVVSALRSFHGRTLMSLAATGQPEKHEPFQPLPEGFRHVVWNDLAEAKPT